MRRAAHVPSWFKSSRTVLQAGSEAKGGVDTSPGVRVLGDRKEVTMALRDDDAGQGAHREVGSEGFAANRRAVVEEDEPVGQSSGHTEPATRWRRKYLEGLGASRWVRAARRRRSMRYPGRSRAVPPDGVGTWAYKPQGEVAGAVREVGVTRGTQEPGNNRNSGTAFRRGGGAAIQKAPLRGKGSRRRWRARRTRE